MSERVRGRLSEHVHVSVLFLRDTLASLMQGALQVDRINQSEHHLPVSHKEHYSLLEGENGRG